MGSGPFSKLLRAKVSGLQTEHIWCWRRHCLVYSISGYTQVIFPDFVSISVDQLEVTVRTKSGLLERRWGVGGEVKTERKMLFLSVSACLVCGNCPGYGHCRMLSLCLRVQHSLKGHCCVSLCSCVCVRHFLTCIGALTWYACLSVGGGGRLWLTHLCCYRRSKPDVTIEWSAGRGIQVGTKERKNGWSRQRETERGGGGEARGDRRHFHVSRLPDLPLFLSLSFLCLSLSFALSSVSRGLCLCIISLPVAVPSHSLGSPNKRRRPSARRLRVLSEEWTCTHTFVLTIQRITFCCRLIITKHFWDYFGKSNTYLILEYFCWIIW